MSELANLVFYDPVTLGRVDEEPEEKCRTPQQALARWLLSPNPESFGPLAALTAPFSATGRLNRARHLLREVDRAPAGLDAVELWLRCSDTWSRASEDAAIVSLARRRSADLGCSESDLSRVLDAVRHELLPMLHVRALIWLGRRRDPGLYFHLAWLIERGPTLSLSSAEWSAAMLAGFIVDPDAAGMVLGGLRDFMPLLRTAPDHSRTSLAQRIDQALLAGAIAMPHLRGEILPVVQVSQSEFGWSHAGLQALSLCEKWRGLRGDPDTAVRHLAVAWCLAPDDPDIETELRTLLARSDAPVAALPWEAPTRTAGLSGGTRQWLDTFLASAESRDYRAAVHEARIEEVLRRVPLNEQQASWVAERLEILNVADANEDGGAYRSALTDLQRVSTTVPELLPFVTTLAETQSFDDAIAELPPAADAWQLAQAAVPEKRGSRNKRWNWSAWSLWVYSAENWRSKAALVVGAAMIVHAGWGIANATMVDARISSAHDAVAIAATRDAPSFAAATAEYSELCLAAPDRCGDLNYPQQLAAWSADAIELHARVLARDGRADEALTWLESHASTLPPARLLAALEAIAPAVLEAAAAAEMEGRPAEGRALADRWVRLVGPEVSS